MSSTNAIKCDRCGAKVFVDDEGNPPSGWGTIRIAVAMPFMDTGRRDACGDCIKLIYETACDVDGSQDAMLDEIKVTRIALADALDNWERAVNERARHDPSFPANAHVACRIAEIRERLKLKYGERE